VLFPDPESPVNHSTGAAAFVRDGGADSREVTGR
jgi:hypothetical protein